MNLQLSRFEALTPNLMRIFLMPIHESLSYDAGQYLEIHYPNDTFQPFSIANAPKSNGMIELHIRSWSPDLSTIEMLKQLQIDKKIEIRGPFGKAIYQENPANPVILLAGGTGFAYCKAIIEQAIIKQDQRSFHLFWGVKTQSDFYLPKLPHEWQKQLKHFSYTLVISQPDKNLIWNGKTGYIDNVVLENYPNLTQYQIYASGPQALIQNAYAKFIQHGLKKEFIHSDMLFNNQRSKP